MKPIAVRPRKFKVEFEELGDGRAKIRYEGEFESEGLVEHTLKLFEKAVQGEKYGRDGNKVWIEYEGDRKRGLRGMAGEIISQIMENEQDALEFIHEISSNALTGFFSVSEAEAREIAKEPLNLEGFPKDFLEMRIGEIIEEAEKHAALRGLRQMIKEGIISKDDKLKDALPKLHEYRRKIVGSP